MMSLLRNDNNQPGKVLKLAAMKKETRYLLKYKDGVTAREFSVLETFEEGVFKAIKVKGTNGEVEWFTAEYFDTFVSEIYVIGNIRKKTGIPEPHVYKMHG